MFIENHIVWLVLGILPMAIAVALRTPRSFGFAIVSTAAIAAIYAGHGPQELATAVALLSCLWILSTPKLRSHANPNSHNSEIGRTAVVVPTDWGIRAEYSCTHWPFKSTDGSPIEPGVSARIVAREANMLVLQRDTVEVS